MPDVMDWLLEADDENPGVRYFTLVDLLDRPAGDPDVVDARQALMTRGQAPAILEAQDRAGYWEKPGTGYYPKYRGSVWSLIYLAQLGADPADPRIRSGGEYLLSNAMTAAGTFSMTGTPSGNIGCLNGNLCAALLDLGFGQDERLIRAIEHMARFTTGDGIAPGGERKAPLRYLKSATCGPGFRCSANNRLPCAWGAIKVLGAFSEVPEEHRSATMRAAVEAGVAFLLDRDLASGDYPTATGPSPLWRQFGFPLGYTSDLLEALAVLQGLGRGRDSRLAPALRVVLSKRDKKGRWALEHTPGRTWGKFGKVGEANKWVTLRALCALKNWNI